MSEKSHEIDLIEILKIAWNEKKFIFISTGSLVLIGIIFSLLSSPKFTSSTTFILNNEDQMQNPNLSGVASLVGINLYGSSKSGEIPPAMYPKVSESIEFKRLLLDQFIDDKKEVKLSRFLIDHYNIDESTYQLKPNISYVSEGENNFFELIDEIISITTNPKDQFISISATMPESEYAANTCIKSRDILQQIIINNKIKSAKQNLEYSQEQLKTKRLEFENIQNKLAFFNDSNLNIVSSSIKNEKEKLEAEFTIINAVMIELSKQVEQNKLQVSKDTPVFSVIKEATIPLKKSSFSIFDTILTASFIGFFISTSFVLIKPFVIRLVDQINSN